MKRGPLTGTLSLLSCWNHLSSSTSSLHSCLRSHFILHHFYIYEIKFLTQSSLSNNFNFFFNAQNLLLVTVAMLPHYQSPVNCRRRKVEGSLGTKLRTVTISFPRPEIYIYTWKSWKACFLSDKQMVNSQNSLLFGRLHWNQWLAMSLYQRHMLICMSYQRRKKNIRRMGN